MTISASLLRKGFALAVVGLSYAATIEPAEAQWRHGWRGVRPAAAWRAPYYRGYRPYRGVGVAAGVLGGLAAGALIAGATTPAYSYPAYNYAPHAGVAYYDAPVYATPTYYAPARPVYRRYAAAEPICHIQRRKVWLSSHSYTFRRVTVCR